MLGAKIQRIGRGRGTHYVRSHVILSFFKGLLMKRVESRCDDPRQIHFLKKSGKSYQPFFRFNARCKVDRFTFNNPAMPDIVSRSSVIILAA